MDDRELAHEVNRSFREAISTIEEYTGLERLTLIEQVALRGMIVDAIGRSLRAINTRDEFPHVQDAVARFMDQFYDVPVVTTREVAWLLDLREDLYKEKGYDVVGAYFRQKQDEMFPL